MSIPLTVENLEDVFGVPLNNLTEKFERYGDEAKNIQKLLGSKIVGLEKQQSDIFGKLTGIVEYFNGLKGNSAKQTNNQTTQPKKTENSTETVNKFTSEIISFFKRDSKTQVSKSPFHHESIDITIPPETEVLLQNLLFDSLNPFFHKQHRIQSDILEEVQIIHKLLKPQVAGPSNGLLDFLGKSIKPILDTALKGILSLFGVKAAGDLAKNFFKGQDKTSNNSISQEERERIKAQEEKEIASREKERAKETEKTKSKIEAADKEIAENKAKQAELSKSQTETEQTRSKVTERIRIFEEEFEKNNISRNAEMAKLSAEAEALKDQYKTELEDLRSEAEINRNNYTNIEKLNEQLDTKRIEEEKLIKDLDVRYETLRNEYSENMTKLDTARLKGLLDEIEAAESDVKYSQTKKQNVADSKYHAASRLYDIKKREVQAAEKLTSLLEEQSIIEAKQIERYTSQTDGLEKIHNKRIRLENESLKAIDEANAAEQKLTVERLNEANATQNAAKAKEADVISNRSTAEKVPAQNTTTSATQESTGRAAKVTEKSGARAVLKGGLKGISKAVISDWGPLGIYGGAIINPTSIAWEPDMSGTESGKEVNIGHFEDKYREAALSKLHAEKLNEQYGVFSAMLQGDVIEPLKEFASTITGTIKSFANGGDMGNIYSPYSDEEVKTVEEDIKKLHAKLQDTKNGYFELPLDSADRQNIKPAAGQKITTETAAYMNGNNFDNEELNKALQSQISNLKSQLGLQKQSADNTKQLVEEFRAFKNILKENAGSTVNLNTINSPTTFMSNPVTSMMYRESLLSR